MNDMSTTMPDPLVFTDSAANKVKSLIEEEGNTELKLRVFVTGGGCSGLQYGMTVEEIAESDDTVIETDGVKLLVDSFSGMYLQGAEVDYVNSLMGGGFTVRNPNAVASCSCGHSFDTGANEQTAHGCGCGSH